MNVELRSCPGNSELCQRARQVTSQELATFKSSPIYQNSHDLHRLAVKIQAFYIEKGFDANLVTSCKKLNDICLSIRFVQVIRFDRSKDDKLRHILAKIELDNCHPERVLGPALLVISLQVACFNLKQLSNNFSEAKNFFEKRLVVVQVRKQLCLKYLSNLEILENRTIEQIPQIGNILLIPPGIRRVVRMIEEYRQIKNSELELVKSKERDLKRAIATTSKISLMWVD